MKLRILILTALLIAGSLLLAAEAPGLEKRARAAFADRDYSRGVTLYRELLAADPDGESADAWAMMIVRGLSLGGDHEAAAAQGEAFLAARAGSRYSEKVAFLTARALLLTGRGEDAADLMAASLDRLAGPKLRSRIAGYYLAAADRALAGREPAGPFDAGVAPDYPRALRLYGLARDSGIPETEKRSVLLRYAGAAVGANGHALALEVLDERGDDDPEAILLRVKALLGMKRPIEARDAADRLAALHPRSPLAPEALFLAGDPVRLERLVREYPDHPRAPEASWRAATLLAKAGEVDRAVATFLRTSSRFPDSEYAPKSLLAAADTLHTAKRFEEARSRYAEFLRAYPESADWAEARDRLTRAWFAEGKALLDDGQIEQAAGLWRRLRAAYPLSPLSPRTLAEEAAKRTPAEALALLEELLARYPNAAEAPDASIAVVKIWSSRSGKIKETVAALKRTMERYGKTEAGRLAGVRWVQMQSKGLEIELPAPVRPGAPTVLELRTRNLSELSGRVYKIDPAAYFEKHGSLANLAAVMVEVIAPDATFTHAVPEYEEYRLIEGKLEIPVAGEGAYLVVVEGGTLRATGLLLVSGITLITKESPKGVLAFVLDAESGDPAPNAVVHARADDGRTFKATTRADGTASLEFPNPAGDFGVLAIRGGSVAIDGFPGVQRGIRALETRAHLSTDRPVYRPGDEVSFRVVVRRAAGEFLETPAGEPVIVWMNDHAGNDLYMEETTLSEFGSVAGKLTLPDDLPPGPYQVQAAFESRVYGVGFAVEAYRKPQIFTTIEPERPVFVRGEDVVFDVSARYAFGRPVPGLAVRVAVTAHLDGTLQKTALLEGSFTTNAAGRARVVVPTKPGPDATIHVQATFRDATRRAYVTEATIPMPATAYRASLEAGRRERFVGENVRLTLRTFDVEGNPVAAKGVIAVEGEGRPTTELSANTDESGKAFIAFTPDRAGKVRFLYRGTDRAGRAVGVAANITVVSPEESRRLTVRANRPELTVGEIAKVDITSPAPGLFALLTFEGDEVYGHRVVELDAGKNTFDVPVSARFAPDVSIRVALAYGSDLWQGEDHVLVRQALLVTANATDKEYAPGMLCRIEIRTTDLGGAPVPAEVAVAVVDEAVYVLHPDRTIKIAKAFELPARGDLVRTGSSLDFSYYGVTGTLSADLLAERERRKAPSPKKSVLLVERSMDHNETDFDGPSDNSAIGIGGGAGGSFGGRGGHRNLRAAGGGKGMAEALFPTRKDFADTAFFQADVVTGPDGTATVEFRLPDDLTEWRVTARGASHGAAFGETTSSLTTTRPLVVRTALPRFLREGDVLTAAAGVVNGMDRSARITLDLSPARPHTARKREMFDLPAGEERVTDWPLAEAVAGVSTFTARATSDGLAEDAEERKLTVLPYGVSWRDGFAGTTGDPGEKILVLPEDVVPETATLTLHVADSFHGAALQGVAELRSFPHNCTEQTANRFLPALEVAGAAFELGLDWSAEKLADVEKTALAGVRRLSYLQNREGLWGWWTRGKTDAEMTAYALIALGTAKQVGVKVSAKTLDAAKKSLPKLIARTSDPDKRAFLLMGSSWALGADFETLAPAFADRARLSVKGLAWLALAYEPLGDTTQAGILEADLSSRLASGLPDDVETLGFALAAIAGRAPASAGSREMALALARRRSGGGFGSTRETGAAVMGLARAARGLGVSGSSASILVRVNGQDVKHLAAHSLAGRFPIPTDRLRPGKNRIEVRSSGDRLELYSLALECVRREAPETKGPLGLDRAYSLVPTGSGPEAEWQIVKSDSEVREPRIDAVRVGESIRVTLTLDGGGQRYVVVSDLLPAGFEPVVGSESGPVSAVRRLGDRMVFFLTRPVGEVEISYVIASEAPGRVRVPPASVYAMYRPNLSAYSSGYEIRVAALDETLDRDPTLGLSAQGLYTNARNAYGAKRYAETIRFLDALLGRYDLRSDARDRVLKIQARSHFELGDHAASIAAYDRLLAEVPSTRLRLSHEMQRATSYRALGMHGDAIGALERSAGLLYAIDREVPGALDDGKEEATREILDLYPFSAYLEPDWVRYAGRGATRYETMLARGNTPEARDLTPMEEYLARYPESAAAPGIAFRMARAHLRSGDYGELEKAARRFSDRYPGHHLTDDADWFVAYALFAQDRLDEAVAAAEASLARKYRDENGLEDETEYEKNLVHLLAQVAHVQGRLDEAIALYERIKDDSVDAREALKLLLERRFEIAPVTRVEVGAPSVIAGSAKNVSSARIDLYPIDLFVYFALQKDVDKLSGLNLDGLPTTLKKEVPLPGAADRRDREVKLALGKLKAGVYLAIAHAGEIERRGIVIVSDLKARIWSYGDGARVIVTDRSSGAPVPGAFVKIAKDGALLGEGVTDARGVFQVVTSGHGRLSAVAGKGRSYALAER